MSTPIIGLLLMAYGTPSSLDEVEAYYTHIRRGRKPTPEALEELVDRYKAIGGVSPLTDITQKTAEKLEAQLNQQEQGVRFKVYLGMKHTHPFIADTVKRMADDGIEQAIGLVLAPHYSSMSIGTYMKAAMDAAEQVGGPAFTFVHQWHLHPAFLEAVGKRVRAAMELFGDRQPCVIFSAHSLPEKIVEIGDPYPQQLEETARAIAEQMGIRHWVIAWQSAGRTPDPWLGPDILQVIQTLHDRGETSMVSCPVGFVSDHLEVLYDIDIECQNLAKDLGIQLVRTANLNADKDFIQTLVNVVQDHRLESVKANG